MVVVVVVVVVLVVVVVVVVDKTYVVENLLVVEADVPLMTTEGVDANDFTRDHIIPVLIFPIQLGTFDVLGCESKEDVIRVSVSLCSTRTVSTPRPIPNP